MPIFTMDMISESMDYIINELGDDIVGNVSGENPGFLTFAELSANSIVEQLPGLLQDPKTLIIAVALVTYCSIRHMNEQYLNQSYSLLA